MQSIFAVPWQALEVEHVEQFLEPGDDEGLTWEAKGARDGDELPDRDQIRRTACGFANTLGGYLIVGAERQDRASGWTLPGVAFGNVEPSTWLDDLIRDYLRPVPRFDVKTWTRERGRTAAVIQVEPVAVPPCMTIAGGVYERVMGKTVRVTDPLELTRLLERGRTAQTRAEQAVIDAEERHHRRGETRDNATLHVLVTLCTTGYSNEGRSPFGEATKQALRVAVGALRPNPLAQPRQVSTRVLQTELLLSIHGLPGPNFVRGVGQPDHAWRAQIDVDGSISVRCGGDDGTVTLNELFNDIVLPAWEVAADCVEELGGYGPTYVSVAVGGSFTLQADAYLHAAEFGGLQYTRAWIDEPRPDDDTVERMQRDLLRARGVEAWEP